MHTGFAPSRCALRVLCVFVLIAMDASTSAAQPPPAAAAQPPAVPAAPAPGAPSPAGASGAPLVPTPAVRMLSLDEAVQLALRQNPTLDEALAAIRRAEGVVGEARSFTLPHLTADGRFALQGPIPTFTLTSPPMQPGQPPQQQQISLGNTFTREVSASGTYDVDPFRRLRDQLRSAQHQVNVARGGLYTTQNELVYAVQNIYLAVLRARELVTVEEEALAAAQEQLRVAGAQLRAGAAPEFDVLRARVQVENVRQNLVSAQATERRTLATLVRLLSLDPAQGVQLAPVDLPPDTGAVAASAAGHILEPVAGLQPGSFPQSIETALSEAFTRRPEIYQAEWSRRAAEARVAFERKGNYPSLGLTATGLYTPDASGFGAITKSWSIVANVTIPIWDAGLARSRTKQARADVQAAEAQLRTAQDTVAEEVKQALVDIQAADERRRASTANTAQAREALRIAHVRYAAGLAPNVEVTDAESALTEARANEVNANFDFIAALAALNRSLGRYAGETLLAGRR